MIYIVNNPLAFSQIEINGNPINCNGSIRFETIDGNQVQFCNNQQILPIKKNILPKRSTVVSPPAPIADSKKISHAKLVEKINDICIEVTSSRISELTNSTNNPKAFNSSSYPTAVVNLNYSKFNCINNISKMNDQTLENFRNKVLAFCKEHSSNNLKSIGGYIVTTSAADSPAISQQSQISGESCILGNVILNGQVTIRDGSIIIGFSSTSPLNINASPDDSSKPNLDLDKKLVIGSGLLTRNDVGLNKVITITLNLSNPQTEKPTVKRVDQNGNSIITLKPSNRNDDATK